VSDKSSNSSANYVLLTRLADEFAARYRAGERPTLEDYIDRYPELADEIRELFPAMVEIEQVKDDHEEVTLPLAVPLSPALQQIGDFRIIREVGKGGMGIVYEAEQVSLGRHVALKVLPKSMLVDTNAKRRFEREAKSAAKLHHTNIVPVFGVGEQDGMPYYVMQFIQGLALDEVLEELKKLQLAGSTAGAFTGGELRVSRTGGHASKLSVEAKQVKTSTEGALTAANVARSLLTGAFESPTDQTDQGTSPATVAEPRAEDSQVEAPRPPALSDSFTPSSSSVLLPGRSRDGSKTKGRKQTYWRSVASIGVQVAEALEYAHKQGVQHRDIKPSNLLLDTQGTVWVTDFGLAKADDQQNLTHTGDVLGTLRYMPPEAFEGKSDPRSDLYSLGLTLYEMLAFRPAYDEKERNRLIKQVTTDEPVHLGKLNPQVPQDLETILHKAIDKVPAARYASAGALAEDLQRFIDDEPIKARRVSHVERLWRWCKRNRALAAASGLAAAGLLAVTVFAVLFALVQSNHAARQARSNAALIAEQRETRSERDRAERLLAKSEKLTADLSAALSETKSHEALLAVEKGQTLIGQGQLYPGMLWIARALERAPADAVSLQDSIRATLVASRSDVPSLRLILPTPGGAIAVAFSPDGRTIATGGGAYGARGQARLWDAVTGQPKGQPLSHEHQVHAIAFAPDGKSVVTGSGDYMDSVGQAQLWDVENGKPLGEPLAHQNLVSALAFSPDGKTIATGTLNFTTGKGEARLWDAASRKPQGQQPLHQIGSVYGLAFCPDGKALVTASWNSLRVKSEVRLWDPVTGTPIGKPIEFTGAVQCVVPSPDGKTIVTGSADARMLTGEVRFWNRATGAPIGAPMPLAHRVGALAFSQDGRMLLTGTADYVARKGELQLWEAATRKPVGPSITIQAGVSQVAVSPDGRTVLTASGMYGQPSYLWELPADRLIGRPLLHQETLSAVAFSPDGKMIVTGTGKLSKRGAAQRWDGATARVIGAPLRQPGYVLAVAFSPDGAKIVTGTGYLGLNKGEAQLWDAATGNPIGPPLPHGNDVTSVVFSPDGKRILTGSLDRTARLWDAASAQAIGEAFVHPDSVAAVAYSPDGKTILTGYGKQARLWNVAKQTPLGAPLEHQGTVTSVAFSPRGDTVATGCQDRLVFVWDARTAKPRGMPLHHPDAVTAVVFSPDGKFLATGCQDHTARVWDAYTGLPVGTGFRHPKTVTSVAFGPDSQTILTGCEDGVGRLWDAATSVPGPNARLVRWVEVQSGMELSPEGAVRTLDEATREGRRESLAKLGGPLGGRLDDDSSRALRQALFCIDAEEWRAAAWHLDRQLQDHPQDALALALRTRVHLEQDQLELAAAALGRALALGPPETVLQCLRAFAADAIERNRSQRALWYLDRLIAADPRDAFAWLSRGRLEVEQAEWKKAAADIAQGLDLDPADHSDWHQGIPLQLCCGDLGTYRRLCRAAIARFGDTPEPVIAEEIAAACLLAPGAVEHRQRLSQLADRCVARGYNHGYLVYFQLAKGMAHYRDGRLTSAVDWLEKSRRYPVLSKEMRAQSFLAMAFHRLGQREKARGALDKARQLMEQAPKAAGSVAMFERSADRIMGQISYREAAALLDVPHRPQADACLARRQWSEAATHLTHLIESDPAFWPDWVSRSCASAELGRADAATADFTRATALAQNPTFPWLMRGRFHAELGRPERAAADFARALDLVPEGPDGQTQRNAVCRELLALPSVFAKVMELRPKDGDLYLARARSHAERKAWGEAIHDYDGAAELKPSDRTLRLDRGRCLAVLGRFDEAAADYAKGLESEPDDVLLWHEAAMAHLAAGKRDAHARICARMWNQFGGTVNASVAQLVILTVVQSREPKSGIPPVQLEMYGGGGFTYGAVLFRTGNCAEAVRKLEQSALTSTGYRQAWCWLFLAMSHARMGQGTTGREFLEKARSWIRQSGWDELGGPEWAEHVELQTLRGEAEEALKEPPRGAKG
jgi:WD40 repeat protein/serine/threonine protein kinase/tetratricopeptide (TPR) repeat protein